MMDYKLAIITPIHLTPTNYFLECIESVRGLAAQLQCKAQWMIVIDRDDRNFEEWPQLQSYSDLAISIHRSDRIGLGAAKNFGVNNSSAEFITWMDADDLFDQSEAVKFFNEGIEILTRTPNISLVYSDNVETKEDLRYIHTRRKEFFQSLHLQYRSKIFDPIYYVDFVYQAQLIRRSDFLAVNGFEGGRIGEDVEFLLKIANAFPYKNFFHLPFEAYIYRQNPNGIVNSQYVDLRQLNCEAYWLYAQSAKIYEAQNTIFKVLYLDEERAKLCNEKGNNVFYNVFLPQPGQIPNYIQMQEDTEDIHNKIN